MTTETPPLRIRHPMRAGVLYDNALAGNPALYARLEEAKGKRSASMVNREVMKAMLQHGARYFVVDFPDSHVHAAFDLFDRVLADKDVTFVLVRHRVSHDLVAAIAERKERHPDESIRLVAYAPTDSNPTRLLSYAGNMGGGDELIFRIKTNEDLARFLESWPDLRAIQQERGFDFGLQIVEFHVDFDGDQALMGALSEEGMVRLYGFSTGRYVII